MELPTVCDARRPSVRAICAKVPKLVRTRDRAERRTSSKTGLGSARWHESFEWILFEFAISWKCLLHVMSSNLDPSCLRSSNIGCVNGFHTSYDGVLATLSRESSLSHSPD